MDRFKRGDKAYMLFNGTLRKNVVIRFKQGSCTEHEGCDMYKVNVVGGHPGWVLCETVLFHRGRNV